MAGKLKGVIPATTPNGCISLQESIPGATFLLCSPLNEFQPHDGFPSDVAPLLLVVNSICTQYLSTLTTSFPIQLPVSVLVVE